MNDFEMLRQVAEAEGIQAAREKLELLLDGRRGDDFDHFQAARLALDLGMSRIAIRELNLTLRHHPEHQGALLELAALYHERGDAERELAMRERLEALGVEQEHAHRIASLRVPGGLEVAPELANISDRAEHMEVIERDPEAAVLLASDADVVRFLHMFAGREDTHARQWYRKGKGVGYSPIERPLTAALVRAHLEGVITAGVYPIRLDGSVTFLALDLDITRAAIDTARGDLDETRRLRALVHEAGMDMQRDALTRFGLDTLLEDSGYKGRHLWLFLDEPVEASLAHRAAVALGHLLSPSASELHVEAFPKQGQLARGGLGNLIKLPLGIHARSSRRALFLTRFGKRANDPWELLRGVERCTREDLLEILVSARDLRPEEHPPERDASMPHPSPLQPRAHFTEVDLDTHPQVSTLLGRCGVLDSNPLSTHPRARPRCVISSRR